MAGGGVMTTLQPVVTTGVVVPGRSGDRGGGSAGLLAQPAVVVSSLSYRYGSLSPRALKRRARLAAKRGEALGGQREWAVQEVSLKVSAGSRAALLGPNGSGKSTLLKVLCTALGLGDQGEVTVAGHDLRTQPDAVRRVLGVVFQHPAVDGKLTVQENLRLHGRLYGVPRAALGSRVDHWLTRFEVADRRGDLVETLSGGLRRRVELAKAMLSEPRVLLLDEPSTGLDPTARRELTAVLDDVQRTEGVTSVLSTHLIDEASASDWVVVMDAGRVVREGTPGSLCEAMGGRVLRVEVSGEADPAAVAAELGEVFGAGGDADAKVQGGLALPTVRGREVVWARADASGLVTGVLDRLGRRCVGVRVGPPGLDDVYFAATGTALT